ncbi:DUF397 domain-containing protein [Streptomyces sp. M19]
MPRWFTSSYSGSGGSCVEVATNLATIPIRDSKNPTGPVLNFSTTSFTSFIASVKAGKFNTA